MDKPVAWQHRYFMEDVGYWSGWMQCFEGFDINSRAGRWETRELFDRPPSTPSPDSRNEVIEDEVTQLRKYQSDTVMPLIGDLLDAWDGLPNDVALTEELQVVRNVIVKIESGMECDDYEEPSRPDAAGFALVPVELQEKLHVLREYFEEIPAGAAEFRSIAYRPLDDGIGYVSIDGHDCIHTGDKEFDKYENLSIGQFIALSLNTFPEIYKAMLGAAASTKQSGWSDGKERHYNDLFNCVFDFHAAFGNHGETTSLHDWNEKLKAVDERAKKLLEPNGGTREV